MSASDALQPKQFVHHTELADMYSGDFDEPIKNLRHEDMFREQTHPAYVGLTGRNQAFQHVDRLAKDIKANGMREPIEVRGGNVITDGHHRALAAMKIKMDRVPVRHVQ